LRAVATGVKEIVDFGLSCKPRLILWRRRTSSLLGEKTMRLQKMERLRMETSSLRDARSVGEKIVQILDLM
jgi:hypothetical protein